MAKYRVLITRNITVSTHVVVEADNETSAVYRAEETVQRSPHIFAWEVDDGNSGAEIYFCGDPNCVEEITNG